MNVSTPCTNVSSIDETTFDWKFSFATLDRWRRFVHNIAVLANYNRTVCMELGIHHLLLATHIPDPFCAINYKYKTQIDDLFYSRKKKVSKMKLDIIVLIELVNAIMGTHGVTHMYLIGIQNECYISYIVNRGRSSKRVFLEPITTIKSSQNKSSAYYNLHTDMLYKKDINLCTMSLNTSEFNRIINTLTIMGGNGRGYFDIVVSKTKDKNITNVCFENRANNGALSRIRIGAHSLSDQNTLLKKPMYDMKLSVLTSYFKRCQVSDNFDTTLFIWSDGILVNFEGYTQQHTITVFVPNIDPTVLYSYQ